MSKIKKAVIAVAGSGTRLLPATKTMPKEMLPIVNKPIIQIVIEEIVEAGIEDIILVTKWDKKPLEDHFDYSWALADELKRAGKIELLNEIDRIANLANFIYIRQKGPYGNGTPILSASNLIYQDDAFLYIWGDDLVKSKVSFTKQMIDSYLQNGHLMIGVQEVPKDEVSRYGIVKLRKGSNEIEDIIEKPSIDEAPSQLADFGRMILNREIIDILREIPLGKNNELWIIDAIRQYIKSGGVFLAKQVEDGEWLTTGDPLNYLKATIKYALDIEEINKELRAFIRDLQP